MENQAKVSQTNIIIDSYHKIEEIFSCSWMIGFENELLKKMRKKDKLLNSILKIINELIEEDETFKKINKKELYEFLYSNIDILPIDITKEELRNRIMKIMAIEVMSKIFDGYPGQLKLFEERRNFK